MIELLQASPTTLIVMATLLGLIVGSFLNVVAYRLPERLEHEWRCQCRELLELEAAEEPAPPGLVFSRSRCGSCGHGITALENIPLLSYLLLRGKCSACGARISPQYPLVEAVTAALFGITAWHFGYSPQLAAALALTGALVALTVIDLRKQLLPDQITLPLLWLGLLLSLAPVFVDVRAALIGAAAGYLVLWSIYQLFKLTTGKEGMGYGDFKLMAALGAWLGWTQLPLVIVLSAVVGMVAGIGLMASGRLQRGVAFAFGPFIAAAGWVALIWGDELVSGYLRFAGIA